MSKNALIEISGFFSPGRQSSVLGKSSQKETAARKEV